MKIIAIAINTIYRGMRMKFGIAFLLFLVVVLVCVPWTLKSDGTQKGKIQITLAYSLGVLNIVLSLLTLFLATSTICTDVRDKIIFTIDTKGVKRWEILCGKWLGVLVLDMVLVACLGGAIYGMVTYLGRPLEGREKEQHAVNCEVLTARVEMKPEAPEDVSSYVIPPQHEKDWIFRDIAPASLEKFVTVKFRNYAVDSKQSEMPGIWTVGNKEQGFYQQMTALPGGSFHEFQVPSDVISPEGNLNIKFKNISPAYISVIFPVDDVKVLYVAGGFGWNFIRALLLILLRLAFIAAVGLVSSTFLTFPVATAFSIFILIMSLSFPSLDVFLKKDSMLPGVGTAPAVPAAFSRKLIAAGLKLLPDLRAYDPVPYLVRGLLIRWRQIMQGFLSIVLFRCGIAGIVGYIIFDRRELGV